MTSELQIFNNPEFGTIRTLTIDDKTLFCANDVAKALGYARPADAISAHCKGSVKHRVLTNGGPQLMTFIPESDLYRLTFKSKLPAAEKFTDWVTEQVLPSIRKNGGYIAGQEEMTPSEIMAKAVLLAQKTIADRDARIAALTEENAVLVPKGEYFDELVDVNSLMNFTDTAKALGVKRKKMLDTLTDEKYLYRQGSYGKLIPYEKNNHGYFEVKEQKNAFGSWAGPQTFVTVAGRQLLLQMRDEGYFD